MRIRLRPYHPTYVLVYFSAGGKTGGHNAEGINYVISKIRRNPDTEVELVEEYDDICRKCKRRVEDPMGSVWGRNHTCSSAQDSKTVDTVNATNKAVLSALGLDFGSVIGCRELAQLLSERIPVLYSGLGGPKCQAAYEQGLSALLET